MEELNNKQNLLINNKIVRFKNLIYKEERKAILKKILTIIGIDNTNKIFYSHLLDENENIQKQIIDLSDDIQKYFKVSSWAAFKPDMVIGRRYISIIKAILKEMDVIFISVSQKMRYKNKTINTTMYTITDKDI